MSDIQINSLDWDKMDGLLPAIIQNAENGKVLMLGFMNQESLIATLTSGQLNLWSRTRQRIWRKGETSGNSMAVQHISKDCDNDSLLVQVVPKGDACHLGYESCFQPSFSSVLGFMDFMIQKINNGPEDNHHSDSSNPLVEFDIDHCAQKTGDTAVKTIIAAVSRNTDEVIQKSADLTVELMTLLKACELSFYDVLQCLQERTAPPSS